VTGILLGRPAARPEAPYGAYRAGELTAAVAARVAHLHETGIASGDRVALTGDNSAVHLATLLALAHLDTSIVLVDHRLPAPQRRAMGERAAVRWLVHHTDDDLGIPPDRVVRLAEPPPAGAPVGPLAPAGTLPWWSRRDAVVLWSSGTTGPAKGVVKSGRALLDNTRRTAQGAGLRGDDVLAPLLPFSHQYGLSVVVLWWLLGCGLVVAPYHRLDHAIEDVVRHRATMVDASPPTYHTLLRLLARRPEMRGRLRGVRMWGVGGAPLPAPLAARFEAALGRPLLDGYGLTEVGNVALATPDNPVGCGAPLPGVEVRVTGAPGRPVPAGTLGEIEVRSGGLMTTYLGGPVPAPGDWYRTRDLGRLDAAGNLHVVGRKRAVHRLGHTLYPDSIERRAEQACGRQVKVIAVDDERRGTSLVFVVCDPDGGSGRWWRQLLRAALPHDEQPNRVWVVDRLPVTPNGKVDESRLRAELAADRRREDHRDTPGDREGAW
jgi:acyl-CoA synthetase (AMP-forming)/AMP-acid ligase II